MSKSLFNLTEHPPFIRVRMFGRKLDGSKIVPFVEEQRAWGEFLKHEKGMPQESFQTIVMLDSAARVVREEGYVLRQLWSEYCNHPEYCEWTPKQVLENGVGCHALVAFGKFRGQKYQFSKPPIQSPSNSGEIVTTQPMDWNYLSQIELVLPKPAFTDKMPSWVVALLVYEVCRSITGYANTFFVYPYYQDTAGNFYIPLGDSILPDLTGRQTVQGFIEELKALNKLEIKDLDKFRKALRQHQVLDDLDKVWKARGRMSLDIDKLPGLNYNDREDDPRPAAGQDPPGPPLAVNRRHANYLAYELDEQVAQRIMRDNGV